MLLTNISDESVGPKRMRPSNESISVYRMTSSHVIFIGLLYIAIHFLVSSDSRAYFNS